MSGSARRQEAAVADMPIAGLTANPELMARMQAGLWAGGALMAFLVATIPHPSEGYTPGFLACGAVSVLVAAYLYLRGGRTSQTVLTVLPYLGTTLITLCVYFSGEHKGAPASDTEMLYLWVALYVAYFFSSRQAAIQIGYVALAYLAVLIASADPSVFAARWCQSAVTLVVAGILVQAVRKRVAELVHRLTDAARTDPLTGLQNRRAFEENFATEVERARRDGRPLSVLLGDLDHFKAVNDRFGHPAGDAALVRMGQLLMSTRRGIDPVARTGGEEFALILPDTSEREAYLVSERLRTAVQKAFAGEPVPLTMSFGLAAYPDHGPTVEALLGAADQALYAAKELGRNRTVVFSQEIALIAPARDGRNASTQVHLQTMLSLAEALDLRDIGTADHSQTVGRYSALIAEELGLTEDHVKRVQTAGVLHDIGKIGLPDNILRKKAGLDEDERIQVRRHPEIGAEILGSKNFEDIRSWVLSHHERPDGKGYPQGLSADEIPLEARILAVADAYEAMTAGRVYRAAIARQSARAELLRCAGSQFDPRVVAAFLAALDREAERLAVTSAA
jgi:diguanylate cyclase (GGDEF)-like protein/putative nucleotidyltransferase with HDIG domain